MLKRLLSIVLTTTIILSAFTAFPVSVNAEEATEPTDSAETYSPAEDDSTTFIPTEPSTELESLEETEPNIEQPSAALIATEVPTENDEDSYNTVEIQSKPELASIGANGETYEQAARYVPNYVITGTDTIQPMYNPYTAQMLLDLSDDAYQIGNDGWQRTLNKLSYTTRIQTDGMLSYAVAEISSGDGVPVIPIDTGSYYAIIGAKRVIYNGQEKTAFVIAFRGTKSLQDLIGVDFSVLPNLEGFHSGFKTSSSEFLSYFKDIQFSFNGKIILGNDILNEMKTENSKYSMLVTGHSLGGALADIFVGYDLYELGIHPSNLMAYTFAAPNSAPSYYSYPYKNIINIYNTDDYVPTIPSAYKRIGTDFAVDFNDDERRNYVYKDHLNNFNYAEGMPPSYWSTFGVQASMGLGFPAHTPIDVAYQLTIDKIKDSIEEYSSFNTSGNNKWSTVRINSNCYNKIIGNVEAYMIALENNKLIIENNCKAEMIRMQATNDYLLVKGDLHLSSGIYVDELHSGINHYGTIEVKGDYTQKRFNNTYGEVVDGNITFILSGDNTQRISIENPESSANRFDNIVFENSNIEFLTPVNTITLMRNTYLNTTTPLEVYSGLDLNGYNLLVNNSVSADWIQMENVCLQTSDQITAKTFKAYNSSIYTQGSIDINNLVLLDNVTLETEKLTTKMLIVQNDVRIKSGCKAEMIRMQASNDYLLVKGDLHLSSGIYVDELHSGINHYGTIEVKGDYTQKRFNNTYGEVVDGNITFILSGDNAQRISIENPESSANRFDRLILANRSDTGVVFNCNIRVTTLFDHQGNSYALYNSGVGSFFVDYDGDGILDHVDPYPTDPNNTLPIEKRRGDADGDGEVTIIDATCIQRYLAQFNVFSFDEVTADADGDGEITILDATVIQRYLAAFDNIHNIGETI